MGFLIQNSSVDMIKYLPGPRWQTILYESQIFWVLSGNHKYSRKATCASQTTWPRAPQTPLSRLQLQIFGRDISRSRHLDVATQRSRFEHSSSQSRRPLVKMSRYQPANAWFKQSFSNVNFSNYVFIVTRFRSWQCWFWRCHPLLIGFAITQ